MTPREQLAALEQANSLIFSVEAARRKGDEYDQRIASVCYEARLAIGKVDGECRIELGHRERKWYNSICSDRPKHSASGGVSSDAQTDSGSSLDIDLSVSLIPQGAQ